MSVFLAVEALREPAVAVVQLALLEFTLEEQSLVNQKVRLFWHRDINDQARYGSVLLDGFPRPVGLQNLYPALEVWVLSQQLSSRVVLLAAIQGCHPHAMDHHWEFPPVH